MTISITKSSRIVALAVGAGLVLAVAFGGFAAPAYALTQAEATTIIQVLGLTGSQAAAIQALVTGGSSSSSSCTFTRSLTMGSSGADVTCLQQSLISMGFSIPAGATGYFGAQTQAAVSAWQSSKGVSPAAGYFGPISQAAWRASSTPTPTPTPTPGGGLQGGAGSIIDTNLMGSLNNEKVGERANDVEVMGLEVEADEDSDIELTAVRINFSPDTADRRFDRYADEVTLLLNGKEVATVDASEFDRDRSYDRTISLKSGAIIRAGDTGKLVVAVSGINNLDSGDVGETWTVAIDSIRFRDAQGASITDSSTGDLGSARTFSFTTFASAANVELRAAASSATPQGVVDIDDSSITDDVEVLRFTLEAKGGDIRVRDIPVTFATSSGNTASTLADIASTVYLKINGKTYSERTSAAVSGSAGATVTFDDVDTTIDEGDKATVVVLADIRKISSSLAEGDGLTASFTADNRSMIDAEDETGEDLSSGEKSGTGLGKMVVFYQTGIKVSFISADESVTVGSAANDDVGTFIVKFRVEALDGTIYVADSATATVATDPNVATSPDNMYRVIHGNTAVTTDVSSVTNFTTNRGASLVGGNIEIEEGESTDITLTVSRTNTTSGDAGLYQLMLEGIKWNTTNDTSAGNGFLYTFNLDDYKTDPISLN